MHALHENLLGLLGLPMLTNIVSFLRELPFNVPHFKVAGRPILWNNQNIWFNL